LWHLGIRPGRCHREQQATDRTRRCDSWAESTRHHASFDWRFASASTPTLYPVTPTTVWLTVITS